MPRKSLRNRKKEIAAQKEIEKEKSKERQRARKEKEFVAMQLARGLHVRTMVVKEEESEEMVEAVLVYKIKEGYTDPFDRDNVVYVQDRDGNVVQQEKIEKEKDMKKVLEQFKNIKMKEHWHCYFCYCYCCYC